MICATHYCHHRIGHHRLVLGIIFRVIVDMFCDIEYRLESWELCDCWLQVSFCDNFVEGGLHIILE